MTVSAAAREPNRVVTLVSRPQGLPNELDFAVGEVPGIALEDGEIRIQTTWISLDPAMRIRMHDSDSVYMPPLPLGEPIPGFAVGTVVESRSVRFKPGAVVRHHHGWQSLPVAHESEEGWRGVRVLDVRDGLKPRDFLGVLGPTGMTSWTGIRHLARCGAGDVVYVSAAAGAVGGLVVQIASLLGATVIGSAGSTEKVSYVRDDLGADLAFDYHGGTVADRLADLVPDGIDVYFDNVGGEHLEGAIAAMRSRGRIVLCGAISNYNTSMTAAGPCNMFDLVSKGLTMQGFLVRMFADLLPEFEREVGDWYRSGRLIYRENIVEGLENAPAAFSALLSGKTTGKTLVKVAG